MTTVCDTEGQVRLTDHGQGDRAAIKLSFSAGKIKSLVEH